MHSPIIIAEIGASHGQDLGKAKELVYAARDSGADMVKVQCWDTMTVCDREIEDGPWKGWKMTALYDRCKLPWDFIREIFQAAKFAGIGCFSSAFDRRSVDFLETIECPMYKIASFEITDLALIRYVREKRKPIVLSTGMASFEETAAAVKVASDGDGPPPMVLSCTSAYPAESTGVEKFAGILDILRSEGLPPWIGLSDHTKGPKAATMAVGCGAIMIEKHLRLDGDSSPDSGFASTPTEFKVMTAAVKLMAVATYAGFNRHIPEEESSRQFRRSIWVTKDVAAGSVIAGSDIAVLRPMGGMAPDQVAYVIGRMASRPLKRGEPLTEDCLG